MPNLKTLIIPTLTFLAGLTTGALVFSAPSQPPPTTVVAEPEAPPPAVMSVDTGEAAEPAAESQPPEKTAEQAPPVAEEPAEPQLVARIDDLADGWGRMQAELAELRQRVAQLEQRPAVAASDEPEERRAALARTTEQQRDALVKAGVSVEVAEDILWRRAQVSLERLYTRDRAAREGWLGTDRYREELSRINEQQVSLRDEVGAEAYDRYLYETGEDNRILVDSVIPGSAGDENGLQPGDVIERYGDEPIFGFRDLRGATTDGQPGELVPVQVRRGGGTVEVWLPRGPIGIRLDSTRVEPQG
jgi:membrane-associated protease RseP (regulator of RpoE activity)